MVFERFEKQKNEEYPIRDRLKKNELTLDETIDLLNQLNEDIQSLHDKIYKTLVREYKDTRWKDNASTVRMELILKLSKEFGVEL